ncbi:MAG: hypothetical protein ACOCVG_02015, partial [Verrucomicrobiota bacterium]
PDSVALGAALRALKATAPETYPQVQKTLETQLAGNTIEPNPASATTYRQLRPAFDTFRQQAITQRTA